MPTTPKPEHPDIFRTLFDDIRNGSLLSNLRRDWRELQGSMLTERQLEDLKRMSQWKRVIYTMWWLLTGMLMKLTPVRRVLVAAATIIFVLEPGSTSHSQDLHLFAGIVLIFVLMLELKDKLLAKEELEAGRAVQKALEPERSPNVPGWEVWLFTRSANDVGGDLVDFIRISQSRLGVAVGDVAGKGLRAALLTSKLQATLRAIAPDHASFDRLGAKLNQIFCRDSLPNLFSSLLYAEFTPDSGLVRCLNAGHFPAIVIRNGRTEKLAKGGLALGLAPEAVYEEQHVELGSGDLLVGYSDGVVEAQNEQKEFFGEQRMLDALSTAERIPLDQVGARLLASVDEFIGDAKPHDDLSVVLLRRRPVQ